MLGSGAVTLDGTLNTGAASLGASVFDPDARLEYHLPWEIQGGAAYVRDRFELEVDVQGYTSIAAYPLLSTDQPTLIYANAGAGKPPTVLSRPFARVDVRIRRRRQHRDRRARAGHARSRPASPWRLRHEPIAGRGRRSGVQQGRPLLVDRRPQRDVGEVPVRRGHQSSRRHGERRPRAEPADGDPLETDVDVRTTGFIYSIAYQF